MRRLTMGIVALAVVLCVVERLNADVTTGLVGWWELDANANDSSGNAHNGTVHSATSTLDRFGRAASAMLFNGSNSYINIPNAPDLNPTSAITFTAWFRPTSYPPAGTYAWPDVLRKGSGAGAAYSMETQWVYQGRPEMSAWINGGVSMAHLPVAADDWYFGAGVYDGAKMSFYLGKWQAGQLALLQHNESSAPSAITPTSTDLFIGSDSTNGGSSRTFKGAIDDVRIYNRALAPSEVNAVYNVPEPSTLALLGIGAIGLLAYTWRRRRS